MSPTGRLIADLMALAPDLRWVRQDMALRRADLVWLAFLGADLDYEREIAAINSVDFAALDLLNALERLRL